MFVNGHERVPLTGVLGIGKEFDGIADPSIKPPVGLGLHNDDIYPVVIHVDGSLDGTNFVNDSAYAAGPLTLQPGGTKLIQLNTGFKSVQLRGNCTSGPGAVVDVTTIYDHSYI